MKVIKGLVLSLLISFAGALIAAEGGSAMPAGMAAFTAEEFNKACGQVIGKKVKANAVSAAMEGSTPVLFVTFETGGDFNAPTVEGLRGAASKLAKKFPGVAVEDQTTKLRSLTKVLTKKASSATSAASLGSSAPNSPYSSAGESVGGRRTPLDRSMSSFGTMRSGIVHPGDDLFLLSQVEKRRYYDLCGQVWARTPKDEHGYLEGVMPEHFGLSEQGDYLSLRYDENLGLVLKLGVYAIRLEGAYNNPLLRNGLKGMLVEGTHLALLGRSLAKPAHASGYEFNESGDLIQPNPKKDRFQLPAQLRTILGLENNGEIWSIGDDVGRSHNAKRVKGLANKEKYSGYAAILDSIGDVMLEDADSSKKLYDHELIAVADSLKGQIAASNFASSAKAKMQATIAAMSTDAQWTKGKDPRRAATVAFVREFQEKFNGVKGVFLEEFSEYRANKWANLDKAEEIASKNKKNRRDWMAARKNLLAAEETFVEDVSKKMVEQASDMRPWVAKWMVETLMHSVTVWNAKVKAAATEENKALVAELLRDPMPALDFAEASLDYTLEQVAWTFQLAQKKDNSTILYDDLFAPLHSFIFFQEGVTAANAMEQLNEAFPRFVDSLRQNGLASGLDFSKVGYVAIDLIPVSQSGKKS